MGRQAPHSMQAVVGTQLGALETYRLVEIAMPVPAPHQLRIRITAAALGYADGLLAQGRYQIKPPLPFIPGCEFAGVVDAVGAAATEWQPGQRVASIALGGALAEYIVVNACDVVATPAALDDVEAAAFWVDFATAFHALRDRARLQPGESVLILGAAGSLGRAAVQLARSLGGHVIAAASSAAKREAAQAVGAAAVLDYTRPDWTEQLKQLTRGKGVDVVFDPVGGSTFEPAFRRLAWGGRHLVLGFTGGPIPSLPANLALLKGASLVGVDVRQFANIHEPEKARQERVELSALAQAQGLRPVVGRRYGLPQYLEALNACFDRTRIGKTVVCTTESAR